MVSALSEFDFITSTGFVNSTQTHVYLYISYYPVTTFGFFKCCRLWQCLCKKYSLLVLSFDDAIAS